ncbi:MAG: class I SAM-dependent methyltransferase [Terriglobia bacterium]
MVDFKKIQLIFRMARDNPSEFFERTAAAADRYRDRWRTQRIPPDAINIEQALALMGERLPASASEMAREPELVEIERSIFAKAAEVRGRSPFPAYENADATLARFCYAVCRALKPLVVLETGVASGITSAFILHALALNGRGSLWSIDLPPMAQDAADHVGAVVPQELKSLWHLTIGTSRRILPKLLPELGEIDIFIHDSLHTYRNMRAEFEAVWPFLKPGGFLIADDVEMNGAFADFSKASGCASWYTIQQDAKKACFGVTIKDS